MRWTATFILVPAGSCLHEIYVAPVCTMPIKNWTTHPRAMVLCTFVLVEHENCSWLTRSALRKNGHSVSIALIGSLIWCEIIFYVLVGMVEVFSSSYQMNCLHYWIIISSQCVTMDRHFKHLFNILFPYFFSLPAPESNHSQFPSTGFTTSDVMHGVLLLFPLISALKLHGTASRSTVTLLNIVSLPA